MAELFTYLPASVLTEHGWALNLSPYASIVIDHGRLRLLDRRLDLPASLVKTLSRLDNLSSVSVYRETVFVLVENKLYTHYNDDDTASLVELPFPFSIKQVLISYLEILLLTQAGEVYSKSSSQQEESFELLSLPFFVISITNINYTILFLTGSGSVYSYGETLDELYRYPEATLFDLPEPVAQLSLSSTHAMFLTVSGNVYYNRVRIDDNRVSESSTLLELPSGIGEITSISAGYETGFLVTVDGEVYAAYLHPDLNASKATFRRIALAGFVIAVATSSHRVLYITEEGKVYGYIYQARTDPTQAMAIRSSAIPVLLLQLTRA